jgi:hypothetical protein
VLKQ